MFPFDDVIKSIFEWISQEIGLVTSGTDGFCDLWGWREFSLILKLISWYGKRTVSPLRFAVIKHAKDMIYNVVWLDNAILEVTTDD